MADRAYCKGIEDINKKKEVAYLNEGVNIR